MSYTEHTITSNKENYGSKRSLSDIKYIVIHYTANDGDTDENNGKYFHNNVVKASAHDFVDSNSVTHSVPYDYVAYSVGKVFPRDKNGGEYYQKCTNHNSVSIELCDDLKNGSIYPTQATIDNAIELTVKLCKKFGVNPKTNVIRHYQVNWKRCPEYWLDNNKWKKEFLNKVISKYNENNSVASKVTNTVKKIVNKVTNTTKKNSIPTPPFEVYIKIPNLNVREIGNMNGKVLKTIGNKTVKIDKIQNGWGRIVGSGWIYLENPNYCIITKKITLKNNGKSITDVAKEVIDGKWGNGLNRKKKLEKAGYNYKEVQKEVNKLLK